MGWHAKLSDMTRKFNPIPAVQYLVIVSGLLLVAVGKVTGAERREICTPDSPPLVILEPGVYDWSCGGSNVGGNDSAIIVSAPDVTLISPAAHDSRHCIRIVGADRVRITGGRLKRCRKFGVMFEVSSDDVTIEGMTIEDSGNGIVAGTSGANVHRRLRLVGNRIRRIGGAVDGHGIGLQTVQDSVVADNLIEYTEKAAISVYWWNGATVQSGNRIERNEIINPGGQGIYLGGNNGEARGRYDNVVRDNTIRAAQPMYLKGNITPQQGQWAIEAIGNRVDGPIEIGQSGRVCGPVQLRDNVGVTAVVGTCAR
jgi:hypothetical protein